MYRKSKPAPIGKACVPSCSLLIFLWVQDELSYDRFNKHAGNIYRLTARVTDIEAAVVPPAMAAAMKAEIPGVRNATRIEKQVAPQLYDNCGATCF